MGAGGWSVPHSELRSVSESVSGSGEEEEDESNGSYVDGERAHRSYRNDVGVVDPEVPAAGYGFSGRRRALKQETTDTDAIAIAEEDEWGVEVDMDMDVDVSHLAVALFPCHFSDLWFHYRTLVDYLSAPQKVLSDGTEKS